MIHGEAFGFPSPRLQVPHTHSACAGLSGVNRDVFPCLTGLTGDEEHAATVRMGVPGWWNSLPYKVFLPLLAPRPAAAQSLFLMSEPHHLPCFIPSGLQIPRRIKLRQMLSATILVS